MNKRDIILSILSGVLLVLIFPRFNIEPLAWVAMVPLLTAIREKSAIHSLLLGWITGGVYFFGLLRWVVNAVSNYGNLSLPLSYLLLMLMVITLGFYIAIFTLLLNSISIRIKSDLIRWLSPPLIWTSIELVRERIPLIGFPWGSLGYSQFKIPSIVQFADITGVYGISFLIVLINSTIYLIIEDKWLESRVMDSQVKRRISPYRIIIPSLIILILCVSYGLWKINIHKSMPSIPSMPSPTTSVRVGLIQGNIEQGEKWVHSYQEKTFNIYKDMTLAASRNGMDMIIWPETAAPFYFQRDRRYQQEIFDITKEGGSYLLFGSLSDKYYSDRVHMFNSAFLVSPDSIILGKYDKIHLVPFGEYVPFHIFLPFVDKMVEGGRGDFEEGDDYTVMTIPGGRFGVLICYEVIFPDLVRRFVKNGAQFMVNITNDAWYGRSAAPYQHISMVTFRAIENRVPIVRAANTGISGIIDPTGRIVEETDIFVRTSIYGNISPKVTGDTFFTTYGDIFAYICLFMTMVLLLGERVRV
jgi:apolipoprotein N-acyltransferase